MYVLPSETESPGASRASPGKSAEPASTGSPVGSSSVTFASVMSPDCARSGAMKSLPKRKSCLTRAAGSPKSRSKRTRIPPVTEGSRSLRTAAGSSGAVASYDHDAKLPGASAVPTNGADPYVTPGAGFASTDRVAPWLDEGPTVASGCHVFVATSNVSSAQRNPATERLTESTFSAPTSPLTISDEPWFETERPYEIF